MDLLCACLMVKNEVSQVQRTIESINKVADCIVVLDTGSTDGTLDLIKKLSNLRLYTFERDFVDFATSRNLLLTLAREHSNCKYMLLLDANEQLIDKDGDLREFLQHTEADLIEIKYLLKKGDAKLSYMRPSIISMNRDIQYDMPVHEYIQYKRSLKVCSDLLTRKIYLYQDRDQDKSSDERYVRDIQVLQQYLETHKDNTRAIYYLAKTFFTLENYEESLEWYKKRIEFEPCTLSDEEEIYQSYLKCIELFLLKKNYTNAKLFLDKSIKDNRIESFILYSKYYELQDDYANAYTHIIKACSFRKPINVDTLQIAESVYDTYRWVKLYELSGKVGIA